MMVDNNDAPRVMIGNNNSDENDKLTLEKNTLSHFITVLQGKLGFTKKNLYNNICLYQMCTTSYTNTQIIIFNAF